MRKRGYLLVLVMILMMTMLTGCSDLVTIPDMTKQQRQEISEYAVKLLLKYDKDSQSRLVDLSQFEDEVEDIPEDVLSKEEPGMDPVEDTPTIEIEDNPVIQVSLEELLQLPETVEVEYKGYSINKMYPENNPEDFLMVEAEYGNEILVMNFTIANRGDSPKPVNMLSKNLQLRVKLNDTTEKLTLVTLREDDLSTLTGTLMVGEQMDVVLLAEFAETELSSIDILHLLVVNKDKKDSILLK